MGMFDYHKHNKKDNLTEKAFAQSMAMSIAGIVLSMIALCSVTFAWFSTDVSSSDNVIQTSYCDVSVSVKTSGVEVTPVDGAYTFAKDTDYLVTISAEGTADTAYCVFVIGGESYYTQQIAIGNEISFTLAFTEAKSVEALPRWGTSSWTGLRLYDTTYYLNGEATTPVIRTPETTAAPETTTAAPEATKTPETTNAPETTAVAP